MGYFGSFGETEIHRPIRRLRGIIGGCHLDDVLLQKKVRETKCGHPGVLPASDETPFYVAARAR